MIHGNKNTLTDLYVRDAMRRNVNTLPENTSIDFSINTLIKHKVNAILTLDNRSNPVGVISKTDIIGAYYAGLPIDSPVEYIMARPPLFCSVKDPLEVALEQMREHSVYRLYVTQDDTTVVGSLAYPDIVGLLYRSCHGCEYSHFHQDSVCKNDTVKRLLVRDVVAGELKTVTTEDSLSAVLEEISTYRFGAILVNDFNFQPVGVISKTDLILAYKHGLELNATASKIMTSPVETCNNEDLLEHALRKMIFSDIHRLFVKNVTDDCLDGVFSLTDAARSRSGSCHACISSRITV